MNTIYKAVRTDFINGKNIGQTIRTKDFESKEEACKVIDEEMLAKRNSEDIYAFEVWAYTEEELDLFRRKMSTSGFPLSVGRQVYRTVNPVIDALTRYYWDLRNDPENDGWDATASVFVDNLLEKTFPDKDATFYELMDFLTDSEIQRLLSIDASDEYFIVRNKKLISIEDAIKELADNIKSGELTVKYDSFFFSGGRDYGNWDIYTLYRKDGSEYGQLRLNCDTESVEFDPINEEFSLYAEDIEETKEYIEKIVLDSLKKNDKEFVERFMIDDQLFLPRHFGDISREQILLIGTDKCPFLEKNHCHYSSICRHKFGAMFDFCDLS